LDVWWYSVIPNPGPLWFVGWLIIFNSVYASVDHSEPTIMACPRPLKFLCWCIPLNILNYAFMATGLGSFVYMPIAQGSLPFDVLFFFGGCIARNNKWLENGTPGGLIEIMNSPLVRPTTYGIFIVMCIGMLVAALSDLSDAALGAGSFVVTTIGIGLIFYIELDIFRNYFNFTGPISKMLSGSAYAAYIIHPLFVNIASFLFLKTYESR